MKRLLYTLLVVAVVAAAGWFYMTPVLAMDRLRTAAEAGDTERLRELVDFPALRQSVKDEARGAVAERVGRGTGSGALASAGAFITSQLVDRIVDLAVQPEGIAAMTRGLRPESGGSPGGGRRIDPNVRARRGYESLDRFVVSFHDRDSGERRLALVLRRDGLADWKLAGVRLGAD